MKKNGKNGTKAILFLCTGNACRSQMAEGFARRMLPPGWKVYSAGTIAAGLHPLTVEAMSEAGIDVSGQYSKTIDDVPMDEIGYVITLCGDAQSNCPMFPRKVTQEHWPIDDPLLAISPMMVRTAFRSVRDEIRTRIEDLVKRIAK